MEQGGPGHQLYAPTRSPQGPILIGNSTTTRELKTHDSNQGKNDFMTTAPKADSSAARACPGKLPEGPAYSAASGWGLPCEGVAFTESQVADCGTTGIRHNRHFPYQSLALLS